MDASAIVKLVLSENESPALRRYLRRKRRPLVTRALARTEVARALLPFGAMTIARGYQTLQTLTVIRINDRILLRAGTMPPTELRTLDAIHLATAVQLGDDLGRVCTYDERMRTAATALGLTVIAPA